MSNGLLAAANTGVSLRWSADDLSILYAAIWISGILLIVAYPRKSPAKSLTGLLALAVSTRVFFLAGKAFSGHLVLNALIAAGLDLVITLFLIGILSQRGLNLRWALIYLFYPVTFFALQGRGVMNPAAVCAFCGGMYAFHRRWWRFMYLLSGMAAALFPLAGVATLFFINRENIRKVGFLLIGAALMTGIHMISGAGAVIQPWHITGPLPGAVSAVLTHLIMPAPAGFICTALMPALIGIALWFFYPRQNSRFGNDPLPGLFLLFCGFVALAPSVSPAVLIWVVPVLAIRPSLSWLLVGLTIGSILAASGGAGSTGGYLLTWHAVLLWLPFYVLFPYELYRFWQRHRIPPWAPACRSVSVVIPALDEAVNIGPCVRSVLSDTMVSEVIVVDGGSIDRTVESARAAGAEVIVYDRPVEDGGGRGGQIRAGLIAAQGDAVAIVHADTIVDTPVFTNIAKALDRNPAVVGGAVGCRFDAPARRFRAIDLTNSLRMAFLGLSFGDQVQFCRRAPVVDGDRFPAIPLMEDVEFSMRLHAMGRQIFMFGDVRVSARRFRKASGRTSLWAFSRVLAYLIRRIRSVPDTATLYRLYYPDRQSNTGSRSSGA